jgi:hypothetical protein
VIPLRPHITLQQAWDKADKEERAEFLLALEASEGLILARPQARPTPEPDPPTTTLYRVIDPGGTHFDCNEIITTSELLDAQQKYATDTLKIIAVDLSAPSQPQPVPSQPQPVPSKKDIDDFLREVKELAKPQPVDDGWQHGSHIDSMPIQPEPPPIEHPPVTVSKDDDDDVADWWLELQKEKDRHG